MKKYLGLILVLLSTTVFAKYFQIKGRVGEFQWAPTSYTASNFKYDIYYYIPRSLKNTDNSSAMVFLHGGGASTMTRSGSTRVAKMYLNDFISLAEELKMIIVSPSGSGLNWGGHLIEMTKGINKILRSELKVNPNKLILSGHSMGGMGITRSAFWLADQFAAMLPIAAGMDEKHAKPFRLMPWFNTPYNHQQGLNDHFRVFVNRCRNQKAVMQTLESDYNQVSKQNIEFYKGSHNYKKSLMKKRIIELFKKPRDLFQKRLYGNFLYRKMEHVYNNIKYNLGSHNSYFWLQAIEYKTKVKKKINSFHSKIAGNTIEINFLNGHDLKKLRVFLSQKMISINERLNIVVNGKKVFSGIAPIKKNILAVNKNRGMNYDNYIDINL